MPKMIPTTRITPPTTITHRLLNKSAFICVICGSPLKCFRTSQCCREIQTCSIVLRERGDLSHARVRKRSLCSYHLEIVPDACSETIARHLELALGQRHAFLCGVYLHSRGSQSSQR